MIRDAKLIFCSETAITGITTEALTGNVIDLGADGKDAFGTAHNPGLGGDQVMCTIMCDGADFADAATPTMRIALATSDSATLASGNVILAAKHDIDKTPNQGDIIAEFVVPNVSLLRYLGLLVYSDAAMDAGKISAWIGPPAESLLGPTNLKK